MFGQDKRGSWGDLPQVLYRIRISNGSSPQTQCVGWVILEDCNARESNDTRWVTYPRHSPPYDPMRDAKRFKPSRVMKSLLPLAFSFYAASPIRL
ncbi:hypothetical protein [Commensalibacter sp. Nvir]|uniref:hypothetical protein n=1 Tax=Commensalibacter sp. Nvir TaxID=3069817 RepID=UPI0030C84D19